MYKTLEVTDRSYDTSVQLHKGYKSVLHVPLALKIFTGTVAVFIFSGVGLGLLVAAPFWWLLTGVLLVAFFTGMSVDVNDFEFWPEYKDFSEEHVGAKRGMEYKVLAALKDVMEYEEVDNFSNRQDLAAEIFNLIKVYRVDKSLVDDGKLVKAEQKLIAVLSEAMKQRKEIKLAGLHAETPALDLAAAVVEKDSK